MAISSRPRRSTLTGVIRGDVGATFVARTALGPLHFDDPMEVTQWRPPTDDEPGVCTIAKRGIGRDGLGGAHGLTRR